MRSAGFWRAACEWISRGLTANPNWIGCPRQPTEGNMHHDFPDEGLIQTIASAVALASFAALVVAAACLLGGA